MNKNKNKTNEPKSATEHRFTKEQVGPPSTNRRIYLASVGAIIGSFITGITTGVLPPLGEIVAQVVSSSQLLQAGVTFGIVLPLISLVTYEFVRYGESSWFANKKTSLFLKVMLGFVEAYSDSPTQSIEDTPAVRPEAIRPKGRRYVFAGAAAAALITASIVGALPSAAQIATFIAHFSPSEVAAVVTATSLGLGGLLLSDSSKEESSKDKENTKKEKVTKEATRPHPQPAPQLMNEANADALKEAYADGITKTQDSKKSIPIKNHAALHAM